MTYAKDWSFKYKEAGDKPWPKKNKKKGKSGKNKAKRIKISKSDNDIFYKSKEWIDKRNHVLRSYGAKCMHCGSTPDDNVRVDVTHIKNRVKYPKLSLDYSNLQVLCDPCIKGRGNNCETDYRPATQSKNGLDTTKEPTEKRIEDQLDRQLLFGAW